jgi:hypothetical protein
MNVWQFLKVIIQAIEPLLVPICFGSAWLLVALLAWSIWSSIRATIARAKLMHRIPCANCQFFTNDHRLKCTVHPHIANTELAIDCRDFQERSDRKK